MDTSRKHNFWRGVGERERKSALFPFSIHPRSGEIKDAFDWSVLVWGLSQGISLVCGY